MTDRRIELLRALLHIDDTIESMSALAEDPDGGALPPLTRKQPPKAADIYRDSISPETLRHTPPLTLCRPPHDWPDADIEAAVLPPPSVKSAPCYFTMRKRVQNAGKDSIHDTLEEREERFVRDRLHKVSRHIVEWSRQFEKPCIVFEDLKEMRDSIDYGTRVNRRSHHLPFRALQFYTSYKASFEEIPTARINPEYTSQRCPMCGHTERANRNKKRFKCRSCSHQDHSDRGASVNIAVKGIRKLDWNVPALKSLPVVRKVRRQASGAVDAPTVTHPTARGYQADGRMGVSD